MEWTITQIILTPVAIVSVCIGFSILIVKGLEFRSKKGETIYFTLKEARKLKKE